MKGVFLQILFAFKRDAVFVGTTIVLLCCSGFAIFLGSNAVVESEEAKIVYTAGLSRIAVILGFIVFVTFYIKRMFENHEIESILSRAISRPKFIISMFFAFSVVLSTLILPIGIILLFLKTNIFNIIAWCFSVYLEGILMLSFALCCALIIDSFIHSLFACFMMYLVGRIIGSFVAYITFSMSLEWRGIFESILKLLSLFLPRLDVFGKTSWLIYGNFTLQEMVLPIVQAVIFCGIFLCIANIDFKKRDF